MFPIPDLWTDAFPRVSQFYVVQRHVQCHVIFRQTIRNILMISL